MANKTQRKSGSSVAVKSRSRVKEPRKYQVVFHNDDVTTFEFVIYVLVMYFQKDVDEAENLALKTHNEGTAVVGVYSYDIALTLTQAATREARAEGYPLKITVEPVE